MSYQQGYPQQQPAYQSGYPVQTGGGSNPAAAIIAAVLAIIAAAGLVVVNVKSLSDLPSGVGFGDLPSQVKTVVILWFGAALILLIGAIIVFARNIAGAFITVLGGLAGIAAVLLYPVILGDALGAKIELDTYLEHVFKFKTTEATFTAIALIASPLALILAILPPTLNYLRGNRGMDQYPPQQSYPQQPTAW
jgi:ABC-type anion transport system duplicated permease subunit